MKKRFAIYLLALLLLLSACSTQTQLPNPKEATLAIQSSTSFTEELQELDRDLITKYLNIDESQYTEIYMLLDTSRSSTEQILFVNAKDKAAQDSIRKNIEEYKAALISQYRDYVPEEVPKLEAAVLKNKGLQTAFVVSGNANAVKEKLAELWK